MKRSVRKKIFHNKSLLAGILAVSLFLQVFYLDKLEDVQARELVVCIDPGHGGENRGASFNGIEEKEVTLKIAGEMQKELQKYEGIRVILTRSGDEEMTLKERAEFAKTNGADFIFCLHLNASLSHQIFGAEVWVSAFGEYYSRGREFAEIELQELRDKCGVNTSRGIKTRLSTDGKYDYYSIIHYARMEQIPAVIIEHCHMDEARDEAFWLTESGIKNMARADATAVARYYGLKSAELGVDYSREKITAVPVPEGTVLPDLTEPESCDVRLARYDKVTRTADLVVRAYDPESDIIYFSCSYNGGRSWSRLRVWGGHEEEHIRITVPPWHNGRISVRVYNQFDLYQESQPAAIQ